MFLLDSDCIHHSYIVVPEQQGSKDPVALTNLFCNPDSAMHGGKAQQLFESGSAICTGKGLYDDIKEQTLLVIALTMIIACIYTIHTPFQSGHTSNISVYCETSSKTVSVIALRVRLQVVSQWTEMVCINGSTASRVQPIL